MGAGASVPPVDNVDTSVKEITLKKLPEAIEECLYVHEKFPVILDPTEQAGRFLKYQSGAFTNFNDPSFMLAGGDKKRLESLNRALVGSIQHGRTLTLKFDSLSGIETSSVFHKDFFPETVISRSQFLINDDWRSVLKEEMGDEMDMNISPEFVFILIITGDANVPSELQNIMQVIKVIDTKQAAEGDQNQNDQEGGDPAMDQIASMYGAAEIIRNSVPMVEAAFDGEFDTVKSFLDKGYHVESMDARKHTSLSEAASQGHMDLVQFLLEIGANPNALNDTGRSALWRAAFNNHGPIVSALLEAGANMDYRDKVSIEGPYDVAQDEGVRGILSSWDKTRTVELMENRKRVMMANLEARIKSSADREAVARNLIRTELVDKANSGDSQGIREMLEMIAQELTEANMKSTGGVAARPRATVEVRNDQGQSLLSIAAQNDDDELAEFLLTHWTGIDKDRWDLCEGEISDEAKLFKPNVNSRDLKGWTCTCIAVFHDSTKVLKLLLEHNGDPNIRSSYNRNAWDLAKDELDAAEHVIRSRALIRQVLLDYDQSNKSGNTRIFGNGKAVGVKRNNGNDAQLYEDLGDEGSPVVMQLEMNKERDSKVDGKKGGGKKGGGKAGGARKATAKKK